MRNDLKDVLFLQARISVGIQASCTHSADAGSTLGLLDSPHLTIYLGRDPEIAYA